MDPALAAQPFAARLLQLHDSDGDGVLTQVLLLNVLPPTLQRAPTDETLYKGRALHHRHYLPHDDPQRLCVYALSESDLLCDYVPQAELLAAIEMLTQLNDPVKRSACECIATPFAGQDPLSDLQCTEVMVFNTLSFPGWATVLSVCVFACNQVQVPEPAQHGLCRAVERQRVPQSRFALTTRTATASFPSPSWKRACGAWWAPTWRTTSWRRLRRTRSPSTTPTATVACRWLSSGTWCHRRWETHQRRHRRYIDVLFSEMTTMVLAAHAAGREPRTC